MQPAARQTSPFHRQVLLRNSAKNVEANQRLGWPSLLTDQPKNTIMLGSFWVAKLRDFHILFKEISSNVTLWDLYAPMGHIVLALSVLLSFCLIVYSFRSIPLSYMYIFKWNLVHRCVMRVRIRLILGRVMPLGLERKNQISFHSLSPSQLRQIDILDWNSTYGCEMRHAGQVWILLRWNNFRQSYAPWT